VSLKVMISSKSMFILILLDLDKKKIIDLILILLDLDKKNQKKK